MADEPTNIIYDFTCEKCGCKFSYDHDTATVSFGGKESPSSISFKGKTIPHDVWVVIPCPSCKGIKCDNTFRVKKKVK